MKLFFLLLLLVISTPVIADEYINGYTRHDGTYVQGYYRSEPNSTVTDNYSYKGNSNPYTGETGSNYYHKSPSSEYYDSNFSNQNSGKKFSNQF